MILQFERFRSHDKIKYEEIRITPVVENKLLDKNIILQPTHIMASALDSLTAQYTDSEGEEEKPDSPPDQRSPDFAPGLAERQGSCFCF